EFRAVGSNQSCAGPNVALNTIVAEALDEICTELESDIAAGKDFNVALQAVLQGIIKKHKKILFDGDNYTEGWHKEAKRRGLPNLKTTPEALKALVDPKIIAMFVKYGVFTERELRSRYEVYQHAYDKTVEIEAGVALTMARTLILPAALNYAGKLGDIIRSVKSAGGKTAETRKLLAEVVSETEKLQKAIRRLESALDKEDAGAELFGMLEVRKYADTLETLLPDEMWPLPSYAEMMFMY
ncbi:MAG: glutamine synthetase type III, partial [Kiritimatiellae bacterium]|nr:glutamine synthetase type III [Kiritimatiellia bacterium]